MMGMSRFGGMDDFGQMPNGMMGMGSGGINNETYAHGMKKEGIEDGDAGAEDEDCT